jgi:hypothetical protein
MTEVFNDERGPLLCGKLHWADATIQESPKSLRGGDRDEWSG